MSSGQRIKHPDYVAGSLSRLAEIRAYPDMKISGTVPLPKNIKNAAQTIIVFTEAEVSQASFNLMMAYYVARFYGELGHHNIENKRLAACIAGIIANCSRWEQITPWQRMINAFRTAGIDLKIETKTVFEFKAYLKSDDKRTHEFLKNWKEDLGYVLAKSYLPFILGGCIILSMVKNLNENNFEVWFKRRIETFAGTVGDNFTPEVVLRDQYPILSELQGLNCFINANFELRKQLVLEIAALASGTSSPITSLMAEIHHMLRGHDLQYLVQIDKYIMQEHPEFLDTVLLKGIRQRFADAILAIRSFPENDRMYIKLLYNKDRCSAISRRLFLDAATVATSIARIKNSTFNNFYIGNSESSQRIYRMVQDYFNLRYKIINLGIGCKESAKMTPEEKEEYLKQSLLEIEKVSLGDEAYTTEIENLTIDPTRSGI